MEFPAFWSQVSVLLCLSLSFFSFNLGGATEAPPLPPEFPQIRLRKGSNNIEVINSCFSLIYSISKALEQLGHFQIVLILPLHGFFQAYGSLVSVSHTINLFSMITLSRLASPQAQKH